MVKVKGLLTNVLKPFSIIKYLFPNESFQLLKINITILLPYMEMILTELKVKLQKTFKQLLPACDLRLIFKISLHMNNYFNFKDKTNLELPSLLVYNFKCNRAAKLNTLVKPNIIEREPWNILVSHHSQGNVSKITLKLQLYMIISVFVRPLFVLKIFQFLLKNHVTPNLRFRKVF